MKISKQVEPLVRSALDAAVKRDFDRLDAALKAFPNDQAVAEAVALALSVILYVLRDLHHGKPSKPETEAIAAEIARGEAWAQPTEGEVKTFLVKLVNGEPLAEDLPSESVIVLAFVSAASLLASCHREDEQWWDYLDRAETALEAGA
ncbi:hypothetical protein [Micromonospora sp. RTGN7]|uniref:hypothetical protein n=1 Tax=Micromonospora sp. RTGN7 TaxID=3016526 RepID=UPI0029FF11E0|nr:hypothetical protein [Micromonospora sp. RTGN7]